jgi:hypothetical protein
MTTFAKLASVALFSGLSLLSGAAGASADGASAYHVKPLKGITFAVGSKRAVGYYTSDDHACRLTLMLSDAYTGQEKSASEPVRVNLTIGEGATGSVDALEGSAVFRCAPGATAMTMQLVQRVAYNAAAK